MCGLNSDHYPVVTRLRQVKDVLEPQRKIDYRFDRELIKGHGKQLVNDNRFLALATSIDSPEELEARAEDFTTLISEVATDLGLRKPVVGAKPLYPRTIKRTLDKAHSTLKSYLQCVKHTGQGSKAMGLLQQANAAGRLARQKIKAFQIKRKAQEVHAVCDLLNQGEMRRFHQWEQKHVDKGKAKASTHPLLDSKGQLNTSLEDIKRVTFEYFKALNHDDPNGRSQSKKYWKGRFGEKKERLSGLNHAPTWPEMLVTIRKQALGTAPGLDGIPIEVFKSVVRYESEEELKTKGVLLKDAIRVDLPESALPRKPLTPLGKALYALLLAMWTHHTQPEAMAKVINISVYKTGDPADLKNYRGLSLISVVMKIMTAMLATRLSKSFEANGILVPEQAGFREGEEAVAQFINLFEVVRRRQIQKVSTCIVFIDLYKAFDKTMHEALFGKLAAIGVRGNILKLLKSVYRTSEACCRVGNELTGYYNLIRGVRQGCPLSPILFSLFINDLKGYLPHGVNVPGVSEMLKVLKFADDVAAPTENADQVQATLDGVARWSEDWEQPTGPKKCGVLLANGTPSEYEDFKKKSFMLQGESVPIVTEYKYLGIWVSENFGDDDRTDEHRHAKRLANNIKAATQARRGLLRDPHFPLAIKLTIISTKIVPLGLYGGEWIGMCKSRVAPIQTALDAALKMALGSSTKSRLYSSQALAWELNMPTIESRMAQARARLFDKATESKDEKKVTLKTWLRPLVKHRMVSRSRTWVTQTSHWLKTYTVYTAAPDWVKQRFDFDKKRAATLHWEGRAQDMSSLQEMIEARALGAAVRNKVKSIVDYSKWQYALTRDYIRAAARRPALACGLTWLVRLRTNGWWSNERRLDYLEAQKIPHPHLERGICPLCKQSYGEQELYHVFFECRKLDEERAEINDLLAFNLTFRLPQDHCVPILLGGSLSRWPDEWDVNENINLDSGRIDARDLYSLGWSGRLNYVTEGFGENHYAALARFLGKAMPRYMEKVVLKTRKLDSTEPLAYETTTDEDSPRKKKVVGTLPAERATNAERFFVNRTLRTRFENAPLVGAPQAEVSIDKACFRPRSDTLLVSNHALPQDALDLYRPESEALDYGTATENGSDKYELRYFAPLSYRRPGVRTRGI